MSLPPEVSPDPDAPLRERAGLGPLEWVGHLADQLGTSVTAVVGGACLAVAALVAALVAISASDTPAAELTIPYASTTSTTVVLPVVGGGPGDEPAELFVHAAGAVEHPGVYRMSPGARVGDLLTAAGGPLPHADLDRVNLAAPVADGTRVYVPSIGEDQPPPVVAGVPEVPTAPGSSDPGGAVNLNQATSTQLESLPGIGPATAAAIIEHRERHGPFTSVDGLLDVRGIGEAKLAALRDRVVV